MHYAVSVLRTQLEFFLLSTEIPFNEISTKIGSKLYSNVIAVGVIAGLFDADQDVGKEFLTKRAQSKGQQIQVNNQSILNAHVMGAAAVEVRTVRVKITLFGENEIQKTIYA